MIASAPFSGETRNGFSNGNNRPTQPPLESPNRVATTPGWRQTAVTAVTAGEFAGELDISELRATVEASALEGFARTTEMREIGEAQLLSRLAKDRFRSEGGQLQKRMATVP